MAPLSLVAATSATPVSELFQSSPLTEICSPSEPKAWARKATVSSASTGSPRPLIVSTTARVGFSWMSGMSGSTNDPASQLRTASAKTPNVSASVACNKVLITLRLLLWGWVHGTK